MSELPVDEAVDCLRDAIPDLVVVYLFGSIAAETATLESDVDLAVLREKGRTVDPEQRWSLRGDLSDVFGRDVDVVDLQAASTVMRMQVVRSGRVIFERDESTRLQFETTTLSMYADLNLTRRSLLEDIRKRGSIYG